MEDIISKLIEALKEQQKKTNEVQRPPEVLHKVTIAPKQKRQYIVSATDKFEERCKKASRATELRHLLARLKTIDSTIAGMHKFMEASSQDDYSFQGRFNPLIDRVRDEANRVQKMLASYSSSVTSGPKEDEQPNSADSTVLENLTEKVEEAIQELEQKQEEAQIILQPMEPEFQVSRAPSPAKPVPEKRKREDTAEERLPRSDVLFHPTTGVVHQNTRIRPTFPVFPPVHEDDEPGPAQVSLQPAYQPPIQLTVTAPSRPQSSLASSFLSHMRR